MTNILNDKNKMMELDKQDLYSSLASLPDQILQSTEEVFEMEFPDALRNVNNIVFAGMGGSALGADVIYQTFGKELPVPYDVFNSYTIPEYVNEESLVIIQSYSGNTEESISAFNQAHKRGAHVVTIAAGGKLAKMAQEKDNFHITINPIHNPSKQPRMAIGYSMFSQIALLSRLGYVDISNDDINKAISAIEKNFENYNINIDTESNTMKTLAMRLENSSVQLVAAEHLISAVHAIRNIIHENAKHSSEFHPIPELDHHKLESLSFPNNMTDVEKYIFFNSDAYHDRNQKRMEYTQEIFEQAGFDCHNLSVESAKPIVQVVDAINKGQYLCYYLSMLHGIDPAPIPNVEDFKKKMA